jgi:hypothetical protein
MRAHRVDRSRADSGSENRPRVGHGRPSSSPRKSDPRQSSVFARRRVQLLQHLERRPPSSSSKTLSTPRHEHRRSDRAAPLCDDRAS